MNGPVLHRVKLNGHKSFSAYKLCCSSLGSIHVHKHKHRQPLTHPCEGTHTHVAGAHPSTSPSHRVIFTQALSPLIGADEGLIGSFFTTRST